MGPCCTTLPRLFLRFARRLSSRDDTFSSFVGVKTVRQMRYSQCDSVTEDLEKSIAPISTVRPAPPSISGLSRNQSDATARNMANHSLTLLEVNPTRIVVCLTDSPTAQNCMRATIFVNSMLAFWKRDPTRSPILRPQRGHLQQY